MLIDIASQSSLPSANVFRYDGIDDVLHRPPEQHSHEPSGGGQQSTKVHEVVLGLHYHIQGANEEAYGGVGLVVNRGLKRVFFLLLKSLLEEHVFPSNLSPLPGAEIVLPLRHKAPFRGEVPLQHLKHQHETLVVRGGVGAEGEGSVSARRERKVQDAAEGGEAAGASTT